MFPQMADPMTHPPLDHARAFLHMPAALMISRQRLIADCTLAFARMFRTEREQLINQTVRVLYPDQFDFERFGKGVVPILAEHGRFTDSRAMCRADGTLFWVSITGASEDRSDPYSEARWLFVELGEDADTPPHLGRRQVDAKARAGMTQRERDVAALLIENKTAKEIGKVLDISPRTVEIYRSRLLRKFNAPSTPMLIKKLLS